MLTYEQMMAMPLEDLRAAEDAAVAAEEEAVGFARGIEEQAERMEARSKAFQQQALDARFRVNEFWRVIVGSRSATARLLHAAMKARGEYGGANR